MEPITPKQSTFLVKLGRKENQPKSKEEASKLISKLMTIKKAKEAQTKVKLFNFEEAGINKQVDESIFVYLKVLLKCTELDIYEPPVIGMIYNQTMGKL